MSDPHSKDGSSPRPDADSSSSTPGSGPDAPVDSASTPSSASARTASEPELSPTASSPSPSSPADTPLPPTLEQARVFLRNESVRDEAPARKAAFLASKGLTTEQIGALLAEEGEQAATQETTADEAASSSVVSAVPAEPSSVPPIVTYPEFLARPPSAPRPPPLVTPDVLMRALYGGAAASALLYGTAKFVLAPMVSALTDARRELHGTTADNLDQLLRKLESVVSVVPDAAKPGAAAAAAGAAAGAAGTASAAATGGEDEDAATTNDDDSYDDPTEVFHRDIGVQTSLPPSPKLAAVGVGADASTSGAASSSSSATPPPPPPPSAVQADRLSHLVDSVRSLGESYTDGAGVSTLQEVRTLLDTFRADVDQLARPPAYAFGSSYLNLSNSSSYGYAASDTAPVTSRYVSTTRNEPDDEIRKAKENIRRVKGALLTARTFPTAR